LADGEFGTSPSYGQRQWSIRVLSVGVSSEIE
jgi:hypothetical protein